MEKNVIFGGRLAEYRYDDEEEVYLGIDDDALVQKIFELFKKAHPNDFNYR